MKQNDVYLRTLLMLQKLKRNQWGRVKDFAPSNPGLFIQIVKGLIRAGWCEYEFDNDYRAVKRLDLPDFAKDYFNKLDQTNEQTKPNNNGSEAIAKPNGKQK